MIDVFKGKYFTAKDATKDIDIATITKECKNLIDIADDLHEINNKTNELQELCNGDSLRVYQNTMEDTINVYGRKVDETAEETHVLADRIINTATEIYLKKQDSYNNEAIKKEEKKLQQIEEEKRKKALAKAKKASKKGEVVGVFDSVSKIGLASGISSSKATTALDKALSSTGFATAAKAVRSAASYKPTYVPKAGVATNDSVIYNEAKVEDAQQLIDRINTELSDIDDKLYVTLRKISNANGFELVEDADSEIDIRLPERMMTENRGDARNIGNTLTNLVSLFNIINNGDTAASTPQTSVPETEAPKTYVVTNAPQTPAPQTVAATVAPVQQATTPGTVAPPKVENTVQARESTPMSTLTGNSGSISGTSSSAPTTPVLPASPISFDSSIPDTSSNSKVLGGYAIPAAAGIAAGVGGLGIAHKIKRDKEDEALFGDEALEQEFAQEFNNQVQEVPAENKVDGQEPIVDDKDLYKFFK